MSAYTNPWIGAFQSDAFVQLGRQQFEIIQRVTNAWVGMFQPDSTSDDGEKSSDVMDLRDREEDGDRPQGDVQPEHPAVDPVGETEPKVTPTPEPAKPATAWSRKTDTSGGKPFAS